MLIHKVHSPHHTGIACPPIKAVYNPKASIPHAASLHQACAHCAIFPTAASRRSLGRISVPMWPVALLGRLPVDALVGHHPTNKLIGRDPIIWHKKLSQPDMHPAGTLGITTRFQELSPTIRQVSHALLTRSPLSPPNKSPVDPVRLACVKHAASVRPEPESNPPHKSRKPNTGPQKNKKTTSKTTPHHKAERSLTQTNTHTTPPQQAAQHEHSTGNQKPNQKPHPTTQAERSLQSDHNLQKHISIKVVQNTLLSSQTTTTHTRTHPHTGSTPQQAATKNNTPPTPPHTTPACRTHHTTTSHHTCYFRIMYFCIMPCPASYARLRV